MKNRNKWTNPHRNKKNRWHDKLCFCVKVVMSFAPLFSLCWYPDVVAFFFEHYYTLKYIMLCTLSCWKRLTPARMSRKWAFASERSSYANRKKKNMYKHVATDTQWVLTELNRFDKIPCQPLLAVAAVLMALKPDKYTLINTCITMRTSLHLYSYPYERRCDAIIEILQHKCSFFSLDAPLFHRHLSLLSWMWATSSLLTFGTWIQWDKSNAHAANINKSHIDGLCVFIKLSLLFLYSRALLILNSSRSKRQCWTNIEYQMETKMKTFCKILFRVSKIERTSSEKKE